VFVDAFGYPLFFIYAAATGIPAIVLVLVVMRHQRQAVDRSG
jgi:PAT family beta-lactamase induction signal transducer AmpG